MNIKKLNSILVLLLIVVSFSASSQNALEDSMNKGKRIYTSNCVTCHMANGEGVSGAFPPLAKSDYLSNIEKTIEVILNGASGEIKVNGKSYYGTMVSFNMLTNQQIADVMNYIQNSWGNESEVVDAKLVEKVRN